MFYGAQREIERDAFAGGGGDGGDSGFEAFVDDGENGLDGSPANGPPQDGISGQPVDQFAGAGGKAGGMGFAWAKGTTVCIDALNSNLQEVLEYSWIHNQWGDVDLKGGAGGGGGGGGSSGFEGDDPMMLTWFNGGSGGSGGRGQNAAGTVAISQWSDVNLSATLQPNPAINPTPTEPMDGAIMLTMGWVSGANPDWLDANVWQRTINMTITAGNSTVVVTGGGGALSIAALDDNNTPFFKVCPDNFDGDTGSFGLGMGEIGQTIIAPGQIATIVTANDAISSVLNGNMTALGGGGGQGGIGGPLGTFGGEGETGGNGGGPLGGAPGAGGTFDGFDVDDDGIDETFNDQGGWGGEGGAGESIVEHKDGIFEGIVTIQVG